MSDTDSFIEEVTEEVRRDRLFMLLRRYGWIGVVAVLLIVGGAAYREYTRAKDLAAAQALGDAMTAALEEADATSRIAALGAIEAAEPAGVAVLAMAQAGALIEADEIDQAVEVLNTLAANGDVDPMYRDIAAFKALGISSGTLSLAERRIGYDALARPGAPLYFLASEQLALLDIESGDVDAAVSRLREISQSAGVSRDLQERASQLIVALGGSLENETSSQADG